MKVLNMVALTLLSVFSGETAFAFGSTETILQALKIMGFGMVGIFIVTAVIIILVTLLNKATSRPKKNKDEEKK